MAVEQRGKEPPTPSGNLDKSEDEDLFRDIQENFENLAALLAQGLAQGASNGFSAADLDRLKRAKALAEKGAALLGSQSLGQDEPGR